MTNVGGPFLAQRISVRYNIIMIEIKKAFENNEEWKEEILDNYEGDISKLKNYDVFENMCIPYFCDIRLM